VEGVGGGRERERERKGLKCGGGGCEGGSGRRAWLNRTDIREAAPDSKRGRPFFPRFSVEGSERGGVRERETGSNARRYS